MKHNTKKPTHSNYVLHVVSLLFALASIGLLLLSCAADGGTSSSDDSPDTTAVTGTLSYEPIAIVAGSVAEHDATWANAPSGQTVSYSISPEKTGISIDETSGKVSVSSSATVQAATDHTITATATGNYTGTITGTISILILDAPKDIDGTLTYTDTSVATGRSATADPSWTGRTYPTQTVSYAITSPTTVPTGISINSDTGEVSIADSADVASSGQYTVTATGRDAFQGDVVSATFTITILPIITGTFAYADVTTDYGTAADSGAPMWTGETAGQTVSYAITNPATVPTGISIDSGTGVVSIADSADVTSSGQYTVTATGTGNYAGSITTSFDITITLVSITGTFAYSDIISALTTTPLSRTATWTGAPAGQTVEYTITPALPTGITFDGSTGAISMTSSISNTYSQDHVVSATGTGDYGGAVTASVYIGTPKAGEYYKLGSAGTMLDEQNVAWSDTGSEAAGTSWSCVYKDGLYWEVKTDDGGARDKDNTYKWGGLTAEQGAGGTYYPDWDTLVNAANNTETLCGFDDWRVPSISEHQTLMLDTIHFAGYYLRTDLLPYKLGNPLYWASGSGTDTHALSIGFWTKQTYLSSKSNLLVVRLVRGTTNP